MQCAVSAHWSTKCSLVALLAFAVALVQCSDTPWHQDAQSNSPSHSQCLLQSKHEKSKLEITTIDSPSGSHSRRDTDHAPKDATAPRPAAAARTERAAPGNSNVIILRQPPTTSTRRGNRFGADTSYLYSLSASWWARIARRLASHWIEIVLYFTIGFALVFPLFHWTYEYRDFERAMFEKTVRNEGDNDLQGLGNRFAKISINPHGGIDKIETLLETEQPKYRRRFKVATKTLGILFNLFTIISTDLEILAGAAYLYGEVNWQPGQDLPKNTLPQKLVKYLEQTQGTESLISMRHAIFMAITELLGLIAMTLWISYRFGVFVYYRKKDEAKFDAFLSLYDSFDCLSLLSGWSALRVVNIAHPALILRKFQLFMNRPYMDGKTTTTAAGQILYFGITRLAAALFGCLVFGVKVALVSVQVTMQRGDNYDWLEDLLMRWVFVVMLLYQTTNAIGIEHVMWWRMMILLEEGGDKQVSLDKIRNTYVYMTKIMQAIYESYACKGKYLAFCMLLMTFDHVDLQHLLLDEESADHLADTDLGEVDISPDGLTDGFAEMLGAFG